MSGQVQPDKKPLTNEEINELLQGDYAVDEAAEVGDRPSEIEDIPHPYPEEHQFLTTLNWVLQEFFTGRMTKELAVESLESAIAKLKVKSVTQYESAGSSAVSENPVKELEASAHDLNDDFVTLVVPKTWADQSLYVSLFDDGWEVCRAKDHPLGNFSQPTWTNEHAQELSELRRTSRQLAASLETILKFADQIETSAKALIEDSFDESDIMGVHMLIRYLADQIKLWVRRHLQVNLEIRGYDDF